MAKEMNADLKKRLTDEFELSAEQIATLEKQGATNVSDLLLLSANEIDSMISCGLIIARKIIQALTPAAAPAQESQSISLAVLPSIPEDESFLAALRTGGILHVQPIDVMSAIRAAIAKQVGLYEIPNELVSAIENYAESQSKPVGESYLTTLKLANERRYGDLLTTLGVTGNFMSDTRKDRLILRISAQLWPALKKFNDQLTAWADGWGRNMANPAMALSLLTMAQTGAPMPPGYMQPPETNVLHDEAEGVINVINSVFAGVGIIVSRALAYDATRIRGILADPTLPAAVGTTDREEMLNKLNLKVGADYVRLETNVTRFALAIMNVPKLSSGQEEYGYFGAMLTLGQGITWDKLFSSTFSSDRQGGAGRTGKPFRG